MKKLYMPFNKGTRQCLGQAMALVEMRIVTATIVKKYVLSPNENTKPEDMDFMDYFIILPKGEKCLVNFAPAK